MPMTQRQRPFYHRPNTNGKADKGFHQVQFMTVACIKKGGITRQEAHRKFISLGFGGKNPESVVVSHNPTIFKWVNNKILLRIETDSASQMMGKLKNAIWKKWSEA